MVAWKAGISQLYQAQIVALQWGHADGGVEGVAGDVEVTRLGMLQWGHADGGVEGEIILSGLNSVVDASMGPRRWWRGRLPAQTGCRSLH